MISRLLTVACLGLSCACTNVGYEPGLSVEVEMTHGVDDNLDGVRYASGEPRGFATELEYGFVVERAQLVITGLELLPCEASMTTKVLRWLRPVSVAQAHGVSSPWAYSVPQIVDLMDEDLATRSLGLIEPPPGHYCALRIMSAPVDSDTPGVEPYPDLIGLSLMIEGVAHSRILSPRRIRLPSAFEEAFEVSLGDSGIKLSADQTTARVRLRLSYGTMFQGVDPARQDPAFQAYAVQRNLLSAFSVEALNPDAEPKIDP